MILNAMGFDEFTPVCVCVCVGRQQGKSSRGLKAAVSFFSPALTFCSKVCSFLLLMDQSPQMCFSISPIKLGCLYAACGPDNES